MTNERNDAAVSRMVEARKNPAVQKLQLIDIRTKCPGAAILVIEGIDDKLVYSQWIQRVRFDLKKEFLICDGKTGVLHTRSAVRRDKGNLGEAVYFFVDRDFDDLRGEEHADDTFMTEFYSVENYIVNEDVLESVLCVELHCDGYPEVRQTVKDAFNARYDEFLKATEIFNFRLFASVKLDIRRMGGAPDGLNQIAVVRLDNVDHQTKPPKEVINLFREPTKEEVELITPEFKTLDPRKRFRGKFAYKFFERWLKLLVEDYNSPETKFFENVEKKARARGKEIVFSSLASKSPLPYGLEDFLAAVETRE